MQTNNRMFDDLARVTSGMMGTLHAAKGEVENRVRQQIERVLFDMDLVSREDFEAVKAMAVKAREENDELRSRLEALEAKLAEK